MKALELRPLRFRSEYWEPIWEEIAELFKTELYLPLLRDMGGKNKTVLRNSTDDLLDAIREGRISFYRGKFSGNFNSTLSRELRRLGAQWDRKHGCFTIPLSKLNREIRKAIEVSYASFEHAVKRIDKRLREVSPAEIAGKLKIDNIIDKTLFKVDQEFEQTIKAITVPPQINEEQRALITREYSENLTLDIKGWLDEEVLKLREEMEEHTFKGIRYESMIKTIEDRYDVSRNKAKFLARQETNLLVTKFKKSRYLDAGVPDYKWQCVVGAPNHPVRPLHKKHDQKIFSWNNPPITNENGEKNHPGEDFNCRCVAIPIVKF